MNLTTQQAAVAHPPAGVPAPAAESGLPGEETWRLPLERDPHSPSAARREARTVLDRWGIEGETFDDALLVVSELVTNAVLYAQLPITLCLSISTEALLIEVTDGGPAPADVDASASRPPDEHGRGTTIIDALTTDTGAIDWNDGLIDRWATLEP
ncbi:ATP-binding protein [Streptomyces sp. NPDC060002]|uniref:ATP-binding protein n=1 Tax=Streptomyces sp. NPDC060002 TaxID=3347033 RepID=UPI0036875139